MTTVQRYEDIEAWQKARALTRAVYDLTGKGAFARDFALRDQMRRACVSIMSNIAEGFGRGGDNEFQHFLAIAKGSAAEVQSQLYIAIDCGYISERDFDHLYKLCNDVMNLVGGFMRYLRSSDLRGSRFAAAETAAAT